jgi:hypothetical protein
MGLETENLSPEFEVKARHHGNDEDHHGDAQGDPQHGDHGDYREKSTLRFDEPEREKKAKGQVHDVEKAETRSGGWERKIENRGLS